jgi:hypothetical protein
MDNWCIAAILPGLFLLCGCNDDTRVNAERPLLIDGHVNPQVLAAAGMPIREKAGQPFPGEEYEVDYTQVSEVFTLWSGRSEYKVLTHVLDRHSDDSNMAGRFCRTPRLFSYGLPILYGYGPVTVWRDRELWAASSTDAPWYLVDTEQPYGPILFVMLDNLGMGGPLELHVSGKMPDGTAITGVVFLDSGALGASYVLRRPDDIEDTSLRLRLYQYYEGREILAGVLTLDPSLNWITAVQNNLE